MAPCIVLFDGECNVCNRTVDFLLRRDRERRLRFAPLQSDAGRQLLARFGLPADRLDTVVLVEGDRFWTRSTAFLQALRRLPFPWPLASALRLVPRPLRDRAYDAFARNRYRWFGRRETCRVPAPDERDRFLA